MANSDWIMQPKDDLEWMAETLKQRAAFGGKNAIPAFLYRYFSPGGFTRTNLEDVLLRSRMRLNAKSEFNDPFDSHCDWFPPESREEAHAHFYGIAINHGQSEADAKNMADAATRDGEYWKRFYDAVRSAIEKTGITCFAEDGLNFLMWSHYASHHRGVVVEFHELTNKGPLFHVFPVRYTDEFPRFAYRREQFNQQVFRSVLCKSSVWRYEMEWRIVHAPHAKAYGDFGEPSIVKSLTLGCQMEDGFKNEVLAIVAERKKAGLPDVELYETKLSESAFVLERVALR